MDDHDFTRVLYAYQKEIEAELKKFFQEKINKSNGMFEKEVLRILEEFSLRPAKRIRPILINVGYFLAGGKDKKAIMETSIFIELIHNMALIHDDIIDQGQFRRGEKALHHIYGGGHYGESMALVAGDMSGFLGCETLASSNFPAENKLLAIERLNRVIIETCYGQMLEMGIRESANPAKEEDILKIYHLKTALYSFVGPLQIGALLAGAEEGLLGSIESFALPLGIAFQVQDDISDKDFPHESSQELVTSYINQSRESLVKEHFPEKEKQFLLGLVNYISGGEY